MKNTVEIPRFETTDMNRWSTNCTEPVIYAYFDYLRAHMLWLETEGKNLLEDSGPLSDKQFVLILSHTCLLVADIRGLKPLNTLLQIVIKKGISSLKTLVESGEIKGDGAFDYFKAITFNLRAAAPYGVNSEECPGGPALIDSMLPIAQACKSDEMLQELSDCRFPGRDNVPRQAYEKLFKNW